ncbi:serine/threonine protein kinase, CMGC, CDC2/CDK subfamily [Elasticomyces elasticus]|nr:serine/threonine protein kinase, CMGC, CDC2/CDK subfamily [Elasticomyces elasticus]
MAQEATDPLLRRFRGSAKIAEYDILDLKLGEGTFGVVSKARSKRTGKVVALKKILMHNEKDGFPITALREVKLLKMLRHPNVLRLEEMAVERQVVDPKAKAGHKKATLYMVMPYMDHDLSGMLTNPDIHFSTPQIKCYMQQLLEGTRYLHQSNILHRDMKAANILISNTGILQIADFGLARHYDGQPPQPGCGNGEAVRDYTSLVVTRWYRPPELLLTLKRYTPAIDLWGVGCIFGEMFELKPILEGRTDVDQCHRIFALVGSPTETTMPGWTDLAGCEGTKVFETRKGDIEKRFGQIGNEGLDLLKKLLCLDWRTRINAHDALEHEYFHTAPLPSRPGDLPRYQDSHELDSRRRGHEKQRAPPPAPAGGTVGMGADDREWNGSGPPSYNNGYERGPDRGRGYNGGGGRDRGPPGVGGVGARPFDDRRGGGPSNGRRPEWQRDRDRDGRPPQGGNGHGHVLPPRPSQESMRSDGSTRGIPPPPPRGGGGAGVDTYIPDRPFSASQQGDRPRPPPNGAVRDGYERGGRRGSRGEVYRDGSRGPRERDGRGATYRDSDAPPPPPPVREREREREPYRNGDATSSQQQRYSRDDAPYRDLDGPPQRYSRDGRDGRDGEAGYRERDRGGGERRGTRSRSPGPDRGRGGGGGRKDDRFQNPNPRERDDLRAGDVYARRDGGWYRTSSDPRDDENAREKLRQGDEEAAAADDDDDDDDAAWRREDQRREEQRVRQNLKRKEQRRRQELRREGQRRREEEAAAVDAARRKEEEGAADAAWRREEKAAIHGAHRREEKAAVDAARRREGKAAADAKSEKAGRVDGPSARGGKGPAKTEDSSARRVSIGKENIRGRKSKAQEVEDEGLATERKSINKENKPPRKSRATERSRVVFSPTPPESNGDHDDDIERADEGFRLRAARRQKELAEAREERRLNGWQQAGRCDPEPHKQSADLSELRTSGRVCGKGEAEQQVLPSTRKADDSAVQSPRHDSRQNTATLKVSNAARTLTADSRQRPRKPRKSHQVDTHAPDQRQSGSAKQAPVSELATNTGDQQHASISKGWLVSGELKQLRPSGYSLAESWVLVSTADGSGKTQQQLKDAEEEAEVEVEADSDAAPSEYSSEYATKDGEGVSDGESDVEVVSGDEDDELSQESGIST